MSKKQDCTAMSSAEAEYVALSASCAQVMWMRTQLQDLWLQLQQKTKNVLWLKHLMRLVPSCFVIFDLEPLSLSFDFVFSSKIFKSYPSSLDRLCHLVDSNKKSPDKVSSSMRRIFLTRCIDLPINFLTPSYSQAVNKSPTHYPCDSARTFRVILFSIHNDEWKSFQCHHQTALRRPYALSWKPCQGDSLNLPDHRIHKDGDGDASFQLKSDSLPHAHAQTTKTFYKHQDSRIMKAQELKTKTSAQTLIYKIFLQRYQVYQGRLLASFQDDAKYEHVGQDTRSQGGKDDQDERIKI
ncbi:hypothetical protein Tco_0937372 [Tanacetum coccineum]|uniref:Retrovirus-related Pol polyprotein from transposon TNT 1-94 n=1 Tax=Tanacetum coccineum TaxID=301880 RepID=A0ABQ5DF61_9ASTR